MYSKNLYSLQIAKISYPEWKEFQCSHRPLRKPSRNIFRKAKKWIQGPWWRTSKSYASKCSWTHALKRLCHFGEILITDCTGSCHSDSFRCSDANFTKITDILQTTHSDPYSSVKKVEFRLKFKSGVLWSFWLNTSQISFSFLRAKLLIININIYYQFISFLHPDMTKVVQILPHGRQGRT